MYSFAVEWIAILLCLEASLALPFTRVCSPWLAEETGWLAGQSRAIRQTSALPWVSVRLRAVPDASLFQFVVKSTESVHDRDYWAGHGLPHVTQFGHGWDSIACVSRSSYLFHKAQPWSLGKTMKPVATCPFANCATCPNYAYRVVDLFCRGRLIFSGRDMTMLSTAHVICTEAAVQASLRARGTACLSGMYFS